MPERECQECGKGFWQGRGRPAKRCKDCRSDRYGQEHRRLVEQGREAAYGTPCARCGKTMRPGEPIDLDHADDGRSYLGWAHARCNRAAGAARGNRMRAAAYRAQKGLPEPCQGSSGSPSGAQERMDEQPIIGTFHLIDDGD